MVNPVPIQIQFQSYQGGPSYVKPADNGIVDYNEAALPQEMITTLLFEDIGGVELINISRHDIIDGTSVNYSLVGNLTSLNTMFNSSNIISGFEAKDTYTNQYPIDIGQRIQKVIFDEEGNMVIDFIDMSPDEDVEVMILSDGILYSV